MVIKSLSLLGIITGMLTPMGVSLASLSPSVNHSFNPPMQISLEFPPAPNRGGPESTAGGGTRGDTCTVGKTKLMPLVPTKETSTVSANPTLFVYVPETKVKTGDFVLVDQKGKEVHASKIELPTQPSIIQISLPETVSLQVGQQYKWQFSLSCIVNEQEVANYVEVKIKRTELNPTVKTKIEQAKDPLEKAKLYASQQIWQDTLMIMAQLRDSNQMEWKQLLTSVGLGNLVTVPFAEDPAETAQKLAPK